MSPEIVTAEAGIDHDLISCGIEIAEKITDRPRPRIRRAIKNGELVARKDGRRLIIEIDELRRWICSLPRASHQQSTA